MNSPLVQQQTDGIDGVRCGHSRPSSLLHENVHDAELPSKRKSSVDSPTLGQRSVSLTTLPLPVIRPRMAQLETLEAKMASIEVSLSNSPRRKKNILGTSLASNLNASLRALPKDVVLKELESLRCALRDKENIIQNLKGQLLLPTVRMTQITAANNNNNNNTNGNCNNNAGKNGHVRNELTEDGRRQAEERLGKLKNESDNKKLIIKNLKMALERLTISDNIDVRIQQAELEYQLGKEELNLLTLLEETRTLQVCLESSYRNSANDIQSLYEYLIGLECTTVLHAVQVNFDCKNPKFGVIERDVSPGLLVDWALEETGIEKGDRLIEVNGKLVMNKSPEDLSRLLSADPDPAHVVLLRQYPNLTLPKSLNALNTGAEMLILRDELGVVRERAEEAQKAKTHLTFDNIRLTHRISYLEEQVAELLGRRNHIQQRPVITSLVKTRENVTNINISSQCTTPATIERNQEEGRATVGSSRSAVLQGSNDLQIFQKGPQVTALVTNPKESHTSLPLRSKSSLSNISNTHIPAPSSLADYHKSYRYRNRSNTRPVSKNAEREYNYVELSEGKMTGKSQASIAEQNFQKATMIVQDLTQSTSSHHSEKCIPKYNAPFEKLNMQLLKHYNARKAANLADGNYREGRKVHLQTSNSVQSLEGCEKVDYASEPLEESSGYQHQHHHHHHHSHYAKTKPTPPQKPLRLSLHKSQSLQSMEMSGNDGSLDGRKPMKRNYKGQSQKVPILMAIKIDEGRKHRDRCASSQNLKWNSLGLT